MRKKIKPALIAVLAIGFLVLISGCTGTDLEPGLYDLDKNMVYLDDYLGDITVINFWATWCSPCRQEIPDFIEVYGKYKDRGVKFIGISNEEFSTLKNFVDEYGVDYPIIADRINMMEDLGIRSIPTTYIVDRDGNIIDRFVGMMTKSQLEGVLEDAL